MSAHIAVAHYPEGAGHATRMMGVAQALKSREVTVTLAGGGPGSKFYAANGFEAYEPTRVDYVRDFQGPETPLKGLSRVIRRSVPDTIARLQDLLRWLRAQRPDALVTDDMFAAGAAAIVDVPLYVMTHNAASFYRHSIVRFASRLLNLGQRIAARRFFYPTVWPPNAADPPQVSRVPPVALEAQSSTEYTGPADPGILVIPSTYSANATAIAQRLRNADHTVTRVGGPDWEQVPAMVPVIERAEAVVCSGYSTVMEAAVAGTPCIINPVTNEQWGVARRLSEVPGFAVASDATTVVEALESVGEMRSHVNGAPAIAERVLDDIR